MSRAPSPDHCPVCGAEVPRGARACPACGADERTGWNEDAAASDGLDLPDEDFDRGKFLADEFGAPRRRSWRDRLWWGVALAALVGGAAFLVLRLFPLRG